MSSTFKSVSIGVAIGLVAVVAAIYFMKKNKTTVEIPNNNNTQQPSKDKATGGDKAGPFKTLKDLIGGD